MRLSEASEHAPPHPPCFRSQAVWADWLLTCQHTGRKEHLRPFHMTEKAVTFKSDFNFCRECLPQHARDMGAQGRCVPSHLVQEVEPCSN